MVVALAVGMSLNVFFACVALLQLPFVVYIWVCVLRCRPISMWALAMPAFLIGVNVVEWVVGDARAATQLSLIMLNVVLAAAVWVVVRVEGERIECRKRWKEDLEASRRG